MTRDRRQDAAVLALCSGMAMALATIATWKGPGLSVDSVGYLATGVNIAGGDGWIMLADQPLTIFPPGLPLIAALGELVGLGAETTLRLVSILSIGAVVALGGVLLRRTVTHRWVALVATAALGVSPVLLGISRMAWSEPPFIAVTLLFLLALGGAAERRTLTWRDVAALSVLCWFAFLLRYVGVALVGVGGLVLLASLRPLDRRALARIAAFGAAGAVAPIAVMLRNHAADGTLLGNRLSSHDSIGQVAGRTAAVFGEWILPVSGVDRIPLAILGTGGALLLLAGLVAAARAATTGRDGTGHASTALLACCAIFIIVYLVYLTAASLSTSFEPTNSRYLSPVLVPAVVIAAVGAARVLGSSGRTGRAVLGVVAAALLVGHLAASVDDARADAAHGIGYQAPKLVESKLAAAALDLVDSSPPSVVYSNNPNALWAATGLQPIHWAPRLVGFRGDRLEGELDAFVDDVRCSDHTVLLVVYLYGDARVVPLADLRKVLELERVGVAAGDGAVFRVTAPRRGRCDGPQMRPTRTH
jgi:hypothetical protein